jgi:hypothetical protein
MRLSRRQLLALAAATPLIRAAATPPLFEAIPPSVSGIAWTHDNARSPDHFLPEALGPGCAFLDYDNDGWMDIYLVNSGPSDFYKPKTAPRNALYKNNRDGTFTDVTLKAGVPGGTFGMGVAVGDFDNDGWPDLFVTAYGNCILYKNNHDGTFTDVTQKAGLATPGWTTSAVWFDYDNDGKLDLFVCSFVDYGTKEHTACGTNSLGLGYYCIPRFFKPTRSFLYRNNGDGTFTDIALSTDIGRSLGKGLGVVATDINNDGRMDLFVANDTVQNFLYANRGPAKNGKWQFEEIALPAEVAFSEAGQPRSGMGVDAADVFNTGYQDLFVANVDQEMFSLYTNLKNETFRNVAGPKGISQSTRLLSGWGLKFFDYDNDGKLDLILANGHPDDMIENYSPAVKYEEPLLLFHQKEGKLQDVSQTAGPAFQKSYSARGLAIGDIDNDGRPDILIAVNGGPPVLLRNNSTEGNHWLGLKLEGTKSNPDAIGVKIRWSVNGTIRSRLKTNGGSYLSSHDPREVLGLGPSTQLDWLEITWPKPSTKVQRLNHPPIDRYLTVREA